LAEESELLGGRLHEPTDLRVVGDLAWEGLAAPLGGGSGSGRRRSGRRRSGRRKSGRRRSGRRRRRRRKSGRRRRRDRW
jgi:hypothetical protein